MIHKVTDFPQFRKLSNDKVFYKIESDRAFSEIQLIGNSAQLFHTEAKQYPEILRIQDMLSLVEGFVVASEQEYEALLEKYAL